MLSECSGPSSPHRLPGDVGGEEISELGDEERVGRDKTGFCEPERGSYRVYGVEGCDVSQEDLERVDAEAMGRNYDFLSFKEPVSFVTWESELVDIIAYMDCVASCHLLPGLEGESSGKVNSPKRKRLKKPVTIMAMKRKSSWRVEFW